MLKKILIAAGITLWLSAPAFPQAGQFPSGWIQGNATASAGQSSPAAVTAILDRALGTTRGAIIERGAGGWVQVGPGTTGKPWVSGGAGADPAYQTLGIAGGGTNCAAASGTCLDNITGFASTGYVKRTGAGTYTFNSPIPIGDGGTGAGTQAAAASAIFPTPTRAGDIVFWNGTTWVTLAGNNSGTQVLQETASGVPSWGSLSGITLTAGTHISFSSGATCTSACTINDTLVSATPTATAGPTAIAGTANGNYMPADAAPAVQKGSNAQFGIAEGDGVGVTLVAGVASVIAPTKAQQVAASATNIPVTPSSQQFHPSAGKAWAQFGSCTVNGTCALGSSYGITSVTRSAAGAYQATLSTAFTSANYACVGSAGNTATAGVLSPFTSNPTTTTFNFGTFAVSGVTATDFTYIAFECFGTQ